MLDTALADFLSIPDLLKARPSEEDGIRVLYLEASNESVDYQGEVVLAKALADSADYFLRYGNVDLDHLTQIGPKVEAMTGVSHYAFEIGKPVDVKLQGSKTFVKAHIYAGSGKAAEKANFFWDSITRTKPPTRWYPSVGGKAGPKTRIIRSDGTPADVISHVRWTNIGLSRTPVNLSVPEVSTIPFGALAKSFGPAGFDIEKAMTAGYGTDAAALTGGGALRKQSLDRTLQPTTVGEPVRSYFGFRDRMTKHLIANPDQFKDPDRMHAHATSTMGLDGPTAAEWLEKFNADFARHQKGKAAAHA